MDYKTALQNSLDELHSAAERHRQLLESVSQEEETLFLSEKCKQVDCACRQTFRQTLLEVIDVLDETRKSFKSKRLAQLRQHLMEILARE